MGIDLEKWKARVRTAVDELRGQLLATSHDIHAHPELLFKEFRASKRLADELDLIAFWYASKSAYLQVLAAVAVPDDGIEQALGWNTQPWYNLQAALYFFY